MKFTSQLAWICSLRSPTPLAFGLLIAFLVLNGCSDSDSRSKAQSNEDTLKQVVSVEQNKIKDEMIAKYKRAIELNPNDAEAHYFLGLTYYTEGALDDAIAELQTSLRLNPDNAKNNGRLRLTADIHYNLACAYSLRNQKAQAIKHLSQAIRLNPDYIRGAQMDPDLSNIKESGEFQTLVKKE